MQLILVVSDLAETVQSLQIIAEQCLPESWDGDQIASCSNSMSTAQNTFHFDLYKCDYCGDSFKGTVHLINTLYFLTR